MKVFFDTNVLAYQFDRNEPVKQKKAVDLIRRHIDTSTVVISSQIVQEFINVALTKFKTAMTLEDIQVAKATLLDRLCKQYPSLEFYDRALYLYSTNSLSYYDALVTQAALDLDCDTLYSEDLQDGRKFGKLTITNPFKV